MQDPVNGKKAQRLLRGAAWQEEMTPSEKLRPCFWKVLNSQGRLQCRYGGDEMLVQQGSEIDEQSCSRCCCWRCRGWINGLEKIGGGRSIRNLLPKGAANSVRERAGEAAVCGHGREGESCGEKVLSQAGEMERTLGTEWGGAQEGRSTGGRSAGGEEQECGNRNSSLVRNRPGRMLSWEPGPSAEWLYGGLHPGRHQRLGERAELLTAELGTD